MQTKKSLKKIIGTGLVVGGLSLGLANNANSTLMYTLNKTSVFDLGEEVFGPKYTLNGTGKYNMETLIFGPKFTLNGTDIIYNYFNYINMPKIEEEVKKLESEKNILNEKYKPKN